jgi:hypothetical protein
VLDEKVAAAEVSKVVAMANFIFDQNKGRETPDNIELQCTTKDVERKVRKELGNKAKYIRFLPPKVEEIRGQYQYGQ